MEIIKPGTEIIRPGTDEEKPEAEDAKKAVEEAQEDNAEAPLKVDMSHQGWMKLEVNIEAMSYSQELMFKFMGWMEHHKNWGVQLAGGLAHQRSAIKRAVINDSNKKGFRGFLRGLKK